MKQRKPRIKKQNPFFENKKCCLFDGFDIYNNPICECFNPWNKYCDGNIHNCTHLKMKYIASLSDKKNLKNTK